VRVFVDNTGIHAAGRCFKHKAKGDDVRGLLQLATFVVFADDIALSTFEPQGVAEETRDICSQLVDMGVPSSFLCINDIKAEYYEAICADAAKQASSCLNITFDPQANIPDGLAPDNLPLEMEDLAQKIRDLIWSPPRPSEAGEIQFRAIRNWEGGAVVYILADGASKELRETLARVFESPAAFDANAAARLCAFLRYQVNECLAESLVNETLPGSVPVGRSYNYAPAVSRARLVRESEMLLERLLRTVDDIVEQKRSRSLPIASVFQSLADRSKGEPAAVIKEAIALREGKAATLFRKWWADRCRDTSLTSSESQFEADKAIREVGTILRQELGIEAKEVLPADLQFSPHTPSVTLKTTVPKLLKFITDRIKAKKVSILTSLSKEAIYPVQQGSYQKLEKNSGLTDHEVSRSGSV
jgi:hypothetical protein